MPLLTASKAMPYPPAPVRNATLGKKSVGPGFPIAKYIYSYDVTTTQFEEDFSPLPPPKYFAKFKKKKGKKKIEKIL